MLNYTFYYGVLLIWRHWPYSLILLCWIHPNYVITKQAQTILRRLFHRNGTCSFLHQHAHRRPLNLSIFSTLAEKNESVIRRRFRWQLDFGIFLLKTNQDYNLENISDVRFNYPMKSLLLSISFFFICLLFQIFPLIFDPFFFLSYSTLLSLSLTSDVLVACFYCPFICVFVTLLSLLSTCFVFFAFLHSCSFFISFNFAIFFAFATSFFF